MSGNTKTVVYSQILGEGTLDPKRNSPENVGKNEENRMNISLIQPPIARLWVNIKTTLDSSDQKPEGYSREVESFTSTSWSIQFQVDCCKKGGYPVAACGTDCQ